MCECVSVYDCVNVVIPNCCQLLYSCAESIYRLFSPCLGRRYANCYTSQFVNSFHFCVLLPTITYTYITVLFIDNHSAIEYHIHDYISTYLCMYSVYLFHICIYILKLFVDREQNEFQYRELYFCYYLTICIPFIPLTYISVSCTYLCNNHVRCCHDALALYIMYFNCHTVIIMYKTELRT